MVLQPFSFLKQLIIRSRLTFQGASFTYIELSYIAVSFSFLFLAYYKASLVVTLYYNYNYYPLAGTLQVLAEYISVKALTTTAFSYYIRLTLYAPLYTLCSTLQLIYFLGQSPIHSLVLYYLAQRLYLSSPIALSYIVKALIFKVLRYQEYRLVPYNQVVVSS